MREEITMQAIINFLEEKMSDRCSFYCGEWDNRISIEDIKSSSAEDIIKIFLIFIDDSGRLRKPLIKHSPYGKRLELWNFNTDNAQTVLEIDTEKSGMAFLRELLDQMLPKTEFVIKRVKVNDNNRQN